MQAWPGDIEWNDSTAEKRSRRGEEQVALCILKSKRYYARSASSENATWLVYFQISNDTRVVLVPPDGPVRGRLLR
jgi:hypothetical protein